MADDLFLHLLKHYEVHPKMPVQDTLKIIADSEHSYVQTFMEMVSCIDDLLHTRDQVLVAIDGNSCAGKSTLAALLEKMYDCNVFHMDDFFLPQAMKTEERLQEPGGNVHYERFSAEVMAGLASNRPFSYRPYSCARQALGDEVFVVPSRLNVIEGAYCLHPTLAAAYDLKVFLAITPAEQSRRILKRNGPVMHKRFLKEWIPLENNYFQAMKIKDQCDLVFS